MEKTTQASHGKGASPPAGASGTTRQQGTLPLIVGITGHRDLRPEDIPTLEKKVRQSIEEIANRCPSTPLYILSPLAEGADRLVARVALSMGLKMVCPLPLPKEEYLKDFTAPGSVQEFEDLLAQAESIVEIPFMPGVTSDNVGESEFRMKQYALVGAYLVKHCQVLVALWNGHRTLPGGTGQVVNFQEKGVPDVYQRVLSEVEAMSPIVYLDPPETGPVYHILTPRRSDSSVVGGEPLTLRTFFPEQEEGEEVEESEKASTFDRILREIDTYNQQSLDAEQDPTKKDAIQQSARYLYPDADAQNLPGTLQAIRRRYAIADVLAQQYQKGTISTLSRLCIIVFLGVFSFEVSSKLFYENGWLALLFPGLLGVAYLVFNNTLVKGKWQDHYQDYRALAEGLRVEFFWRLAGLPCGSAADHYFREQRTELDWIRIAVRNLSLDFDSEDRLSKCDKVEDFEAVSKFWVADQTKYFKKAAHRDEHQLEKIEALVGRFVAAGPLIALIIGIALILPGPTQNFLRGVTTSHAEPAEAGHGEPAKPAGHGEPAGHEEPAPTNVTTENGDLATEVKAHGGGHDTHGPGYYFYKGLIIVIFTLAATGGVLHTYIDKRALPQQVKQYERMAVLFDMADKHLDTFLLAKDFDRARQVIVELGRASLAENGAWVLTHRERPVEVPHAG